MTLSPRINTTLPIILFQLRNRIISQGIYTATSVFIGVDPKNNVVPPNISYCILNVIDQTVIDWETVTSQPGNAAYPTPTIEGYITIDVWQKYSLDIAAREDIILTQQSLGIFAITGAINLALEQYDLLDSNQPILAEPLRLVREMPINRDKTGWHNIQQIWRIRYGYDPAAFSPTVGNIDEFTNEMTGEFI